MVSSYDNHESRSILHGKKEETESNTWELLHIEFSLDSVEFTDNKVSGTIKITPKEARDLIDKFSLVYGNNCTEFYSEFHRISVDGFDPFKRDHEIRVDAIRKSRKLEVKESEPCKFTINRQIPSLSPTLTLNREDPLSSAPHPLYDLVIRWCHIGDKSAQKYVVCLDDKEVFYIRKPTSKGTFKVHIRSFQFDDEVSHHTIEIIARLNNDDETVRSDLIKFKAPDKNVEKTEVITVLNISEDPNKDIDTEDDNTEDNKGQKNVPSTPNKNLHSTKKSESPRKSTAKLDEMIATRSCSCLQPHDSFPGIKHYLNRNDHKPLPSPLTKRKPGDENEDDDDVVSTSSFAD